jgi:hypothetical protein
VHDRAARLCSTSHASLQKLNLLGGRASQAPSHLANQGAGQASSQSTKPTLARHTCHCLPACQHACLPACLPASMPVCHDAWFWSMAEPHIPPHWPFPAQRVPLQKGSKHGLTHLGSRVCLGDRQLPKMPGPGTATCCCPRARDCWGLHVIARVYPSA